MKSASRKSARRGASSPASQLAARYAQRIEQAAGRVYAVAQVTPLLPAPRMSARLGNTVLLKRALNCENVSRIVIDD